MATNHSDALFDFDVSKYLGDFKVPGLDVETIVASQRKNIEALTQANKLAFEGLQNVVKRQVEILRQSFDEIAQLSKEFSEPGTPGDKAARQAEIAKDSFERVLGNARELTELVTKANSEAFELLNKRFTQSLEEAREAFAKTAGKK